LVEIPVELLENKAIKSLNLSRNRISTLPMVSDSAIQSLYLSQNELLKLPSLSGFKQLELLDLSKNKLNRIDHHCFDLLFHLKTLHLNETNLEVLPDLSDLISLQLLDISSTRITRLDPSIASLAHLMYLRLSNPLPFDSAFELSRDPFMFRNYQYPPPEICAKGLPEIITYLKSHDYPNAKSISSTTLCDYTRFDTRSSQIISQATSRHDSMNSNVSIALSLKNGPEETNPVEIKQEPQMEVKEPRAPTKTEPRTESITSLKLKGVGNWFDFMLSFKAALETDTSPDEINQIYQQLMATFFDSIHLHIIPCFCPCGMQSKSNLSSFTFKIDAFLTALDSHCISTKIKYQVIKSIISFIETVLMNALFIRTNLVSNFKMIKKSVKTFYEWVDGVTSSSPRLLAIDRLMMIHDRVSNSVSPVQFQQLRNEIKYAASGTGPLSPQQILKWIEILLKQQGVVPVWYDQLKKEFGYTLTSTKRSSSLFKNTNMLVPLIY
jgi:hypothetical protein